MVYSIYGSCYSDRQNVALLFTFMDLSQKPWLMRLNSLGYDNLGVPWTSLAITSLASFCIELCRAGFCNELFGCCCFKILFCHSNVSFPTILGHHSPCGDAEYVAWHVHEFLIPYWSNSVQWYLCICDHPPRNQCKVTPGSFSVYVISRKYLS